MARTGKPSRNNMKYSSSHYLLTGNAARKKWFPILRLQTVVEVIRKPILLLLAKVLILFSRFAKNMQKFLVPLLKRFGKWNSRAWKSFLACENTFYHLSHYFAAFSVCYQIGWYYVLIGEVLGAVIRLYFFEELGMFFCFTYLYLVTLIGGNRWWLSTTTIISIAIGIIPSTQSLFPFLTFFWIALSCFLSGGFLALTLCWALACFRENFPQAFYPLEFFKHLQKSDVETPVEIPQNEVNEIPPLEALENPTFQEVEESPPSSVEMELSSEEDEVEIRNILRESEVESEEGREKEKDDFFEFDEDREISSVGASTSGREPKISPEAEVARILECEDHYSVFELSFGKIDGFRLRREYRKKAVLVHPDKHGGKKEAAEAFKKLQNAYELFQDENKKADYDREFEKRLFCTSVVERAAILRKLKGIPPNGRLTLCTLCKVEHLWLLVNRDPQKGRWCQECEGYHAVSNNEGWIEQEAELVFGVLPRLTKKNAFVMEGNKIYNVTEWAECQGLLKYPPNVHNITFVPRAQKGTQRRLTLPENYEEMTKEEIYDYFADTLLHGFEMEDVLWAFFEDREKKEDNRDDSPKKSSKQSEIPKNYKKSRKSRFK